MPFHICIWKAIKGWKREWPGKRLILNRVHWKFNQWRWNNVCWGGGALLPFSCGTNTFVSQSLADQSDVTALQGDSGLEPPVAKKAKLDGDALAPYAHSLAGEGDSASSGLSTPPLLYLTRVRGIKDCYNAPGIAIGIKGQGWYTYYLESHTQNPSVNWSGNETTDTTRVFPGETEESTAAVLTNIASGDSCSGTLKIVCTFWRMYH